ncbi:MAG TPA: MraY family glycosyltransferase [Bacteroidales bacterium]|nr:MraY family glycosyltransferase [Bacteroidales bacterium]
MDLILLIASMLLSFALVLITTPPIVRVARAKRIFDVTDERKVHTLSVPTLGGIAIFIAVSITTALFSSGYPTPDHHYVYAAMVTLFFVGIKDDIVFINPRTKFIIQLLVAIMLVGLGGYSLNNWQGVLAMFKVAPILGNIVTVALIVLLINAYNLIDGIDGLASGLGLMASLFFGIWFYINGIYIYALFSLSLAGALIGFMRFNLFGKQYKIFMGDTGSLLLGLMMAMQVVWFINMNLDKGLPYHVNNAPALALAIVAVPLIDALRVFILRLARGKSPFSPDQSHVHHRMLNFFPRHIHTTILMVFMNLMLVAIAVLLDYSRLSVNYQFLIILLTGILGTTLPGVILVSMKKNGKIEPVLPVRERPGVRVLTYKIKYNGHMISHPELKPEETEK